ncbi:hypothetical protein NK6_2121 [Bradyrhizobium diazoefficiens]|uniref:Uncharacterized protein n=1 Tax=Bradyrhizobium diazoefficiens TaxID=1355477 RepID=A0A0E4BLM9_9BRAD|nr:hypothetical protein NK6_2121 [Bradyrhizobium diazoefficiens]
MFHGVISQRREAADLCIRHPDNQPGCRPGRS